MVRVKKIMDKEDKFERKKLKKKKKNEKGECKRRKERKKKIGWLVGWLFCFMVYQPFSGHLTWKQVILMKTCVFDWVAHQLL